MEPALRDGDWLIARPARRLAVGSLVVVRDPVDRSRLLVKRVASVTAEAIEVTSDAAHRDHLTARVVPISDVLGVPVLRYAPLRRLGRVR